MKKILMFLSTLGFLSTNSLSVIACENENGLIPNFFEYYGSNGKITSICTGNGNNDPNYFYASSDNGKVYKSNQSNHLDEITGTSGIITSLASDVSSRFFASSDNGKVYGSEAGGEFIDLNWSFGNISFLISDKNKNKIYALCKNNDVYQYFNNSWTKDNRIVGVGNISFFEIGLSGDIFIINDKNEIYKTNDDSSSLIMINKFSQKINNLFIDCNNNLYISTNNSIYKNNQSNKFTEIKNVKEGIKNFNVDSIGFIFYETNSNKIYKQIANGNFEEILLNKMGIKNNVKFLIQVLHYLNMYTSLIIVTESGNIYNIN